MLLLGDADALLEDLRVSLDTGDVSLGLYELKEVIHPPYREVFGSLVYQDGIFNELHLGTYVDYRHFYLFSVLFLLQRRLISVC